MNHLKCYDFSGYSVLKLTFTLYTQGHLPLSILQAWLKVLVTTLQDSATPDAASALLLPDFHVYETCREQPWHTLSQIWYVDDREVRTLYVLLIAQTRRSSYSHAQYFARLKDRPH